MLRQARTAGTRLYGYVVPAHGSKLDVAALRQRLAASLPDYMIPSAIIEVPALAFHVERQAGSPCAACTGRISKSRLLEPPVGQIEAALAAIWSSVLKVERVGRHDNFFELGGDLDAGAVVHRERSSSTRSIRR